ncbi:MAG: ArsR/SmtB family transcription factor [bacterium]
MVKFSPSLDTTFAALADPTRRAILARLSGGEASVTTLASPHRMSLPAVSKHLRVLERAGLLTRRKDGRIHRCRLAGAPLRDAAGWLARYRQFWETQFDSLARHLEATSGGEQPGWPRPSPKRRPSSSRGRSPRRARRSSARGRSRKS